jgi:hypothetical protein
MTAEEIGALAKLLTLIGGWPLATIVVLASLAAVVAPWYVLWKFTGKLIEMLTGQKQALETHMAEQKLRLETHMTEIRKQNEAGWKAYADNVDLVREMQAIAKGYAELAGQQAETIYLNTQMMTTLVDAIKNNLFCPSVRKAMGKDT